MGSSIADPRSWADLMGRELERAELQPLQTTRVNKHGAVRIRWGSLRAAGFGEGDRVGAILRDGRCVLQRQDGGIALQKGKDASIPVADPVPNTLCAHHNAGAIYIVKEGEATILAIRVQEHPPDLLGPRFIDELHHDHIVRHAIPGPAHDDWTPEALAELEELLCCEPFRIDPAAAIADGDDWVGWMTRSRILGRPAPDDAALHKRLVANILDDGRDDGSWGTVPATAYAILRLLALGVPSSGSHVERAAQWLLALPEPPPRPGMWMLTGQYLDEWLAKREPKESRELAACEILRVPPDESVNFFSWAFPDAEQDPFRAQECQRVVPTCARHHPPACEPRITHVSALVAEALLRCGHADHPRLRRYANTVFHLGGEWGYWCGCGALGLYDPDVPPSEDPPDFDHRAAADDGAADLSPWRWVADASESAALANRPGAEPRGTHLEPFSWRRVPGEESRFALIGSAWQNGDCCVKTNRALAQHPACRGSLVECQALFQASRYQTSLGEWDQAFPAGMLAWLSLYDQPMAKALVAKTVPWLRTHQADDGLWHHEELPRNDWGKPAHPPEPRLATYHIVAALHRFDLLERLRP